ncbi:MAG: beta-carotene ketolase, partial [bacterium]
MQNQPITPNKGIFIALSIIMLWATSLIFLLSINIAMMPLLGIVSAMLLQTFLYTGLFITAHDAMHRLVAPKYKKLNNFSGTLCV